MAFGLERKIFKAQLEKLGAKVVDTPNENHYLRVNDTYDICYTNFYFRHVGDIEFIAQGKQAFLEMIKNQMNEKQL